MRYLRHAPLSFWAAVLLVLAGTLVIGMLASANGQSPTGLVAAPADAPRADVDLLVTGLSAAYPALSTGTGEQWATQYAEQARAARSRYLQTKRTPELDRAWLDVTAAADSLALADGADTREFTARTGVLGAAVGRLAALNPR